MLAPASPRPQDAGQRLPALVQVADEQTEAEPALEVPAGPSFSECAVTGVASKSKMIRSGPAPFAKARSRACRRSSRRTPSRSGVIASRRRSAWDVALRVGASSRRGARLAARRSGRLSGVGVVVDQAGEEGDQVGALLGGEGGEKLILHLGK